MRYQTTFAHSLKSYPYLFLLKSKNLRCLWCGKMMLPPSGAWLFFRPMDSLLRGLADGVPITTDTMLSPEAIVVLQILWVVVATCGAGDYMPIIWQHAGDWHPMGVRLWVWVPMGVGADHPWLIRKNAARSDVDNSFIMANYAPIAWSRHLVDCWGELMLLVWVGVNHLVVLSV